MIWAGLRWLPLMFLVAQGLEAPLVAHPSQLIKPIRVWSAKTSWYGGKFNGRKTASGEKYDMFASTGASPDLPFGSLIRISNPKTHTAQLVRINDRGPFVDDRELDVSYLVACRLGIQDQGVARLANRTSRGAETPLTDRARQKLILALDFPSIEPAFDLAQSLSSLVGMFKINIHLFTAAGPSAVDKLRQLGPEIFLDLKFHDIPNTVMGAVSAACSLPGVRLLDVHTLGGLDMMCAAVAARDNSRLPKGERPKLLGVTILTSMNNDALREGGHCWPGVKERREAGPSGSPGRPRRRGGIAPGNTGHPPRLREGLSDCCSRGPARRLEWVPDAPESGTQTTRRVSQPLRKRFVMERTIL